MRGGRTLSSAYSLAGEQMRGWVGGWVRTKAGGGTKAGQGTEAVGKEGGQRRATCCPGTSLSFWYQVLVPGTEGGAGAAGIQALLGRCGALHALGIFMGRGGAYCSCCCPPARSQSRGLRRGSSTPGRCPWSRCNCHLWTPAQGGRKVGRAGGCWREGGRKRRGQAGVREGGRIK